jgi:hypothetical protein
MERRYSYSCSWYLTGIAGQLYIPVASDPTSQRISQISWLGERLDGPKCLSRYSSNEEKGSCLYRVTNLGVFNTFRLRYSLSYHREAHAKLDRIFYFVC